MKIKHIILTTLIVCTLAIGLTACATGANQKPPTAIEKALFDVTTNVSTVTNYVAVTNFYSQTNYVAVPVTVTNIQNQVVTTTNITTVTNILPLVQMVPVISQQTNWDLAPKASVTATASGLGALIPGWGTVGAGLLALGLGLWGKARSNTATNVSDAAGLAQQALVVAQNVIKSLPNGAAVAAEFNTWLASHQSDVNLAQDIAQIVDTYVDHPAASNAAAGIVATALSPIIVGGPQPAAVPAAKPAAVATVG